MPRKKQVKEVIHERILRTFPFYGPYSQLLKDLDVEIQGYVNELTSEGYVLSREPYITTYSESEYWGEATKEVQAVKLHRYLTDEEIKEAAREKRKLASMKKESERIKADMEQKAQRELYEQLKAKFGE